MVAVLFLSLATSTAQTEPLPMSVEEPQIKPQIAPERILTPKEEIDALIDKYALKYGVSTSSMKAIIRCESTYNPNAVGDYGQSFGLVQIHLPSHPNITKSQALTPEFAVSFLAKSLSNGDAWMWTCARNLGIK